MEKRKRGKESVLNNQSVNNQQVPVEQKTLFQKGLLRDEHWSKDELLDVVYWIRQLFSIVIGIIWGFSSFQGAIALVGYFGVSTMLIFVYCSSYLKTDVHAVGEYEVAKEGFLSSFALFLLIWILTYSFVY